MQKYLFDGSVYLNDTQVVGNWKASTLAKSSNQALSNLKYRFKHAHSLALYSRVDLIGNITVETKDGTILRY